MDGRRSKTVKPSVNVFSAYAAGSSDRFGVGIVLSRHGVTPESIIESISMITVAIVARVILKGNAIVCDIGYMSSVIHAI